MGGCSSSTDDAEMPKLSSSILENKFKTIEKKTFQLPINLNAALEVHSSNGKITDFITKNESPLYLAYQQLDLQASLDSDKKFEDKEFPHNQDSIGAEQYPEKIEWKRVGDFLKQFKIFEGKIEPLDIKQGRLGDCYLLSAITAISEYPFVVKRLFQTTETSSYSYYGIWLFIDGLWRCVVIDDYFPLHGGRPIFAKDHSEEIWVMLIEKAYAKTFKNYQAIQSGLTGIALNALTGAPFEYLNKDSKSSIDVETAWNFLTQNFSMQHIMTGSTQNNDRNGYLGLVSSHAYTIIDIQQIYIATKKEKKKKQRILKMSNPWGKYEWKGRWSDYSDVWSEELRQQLHFQKADDGIFWINIQDFVQNFGQICACKYNKNYISTSLPLTFSKDLENEFKGVFLSTSNRTEGYITLVQQDHRKFTKNYQYSLIRLIVLKFDKGTSTLGAYINDVIDCDRDGTLKVQLDPGEYYLIIEIYWKCNFTRDVVVNFYGQHPVNLTEDKKPLEMSSLFNEIVLLHQKFTEKQRIYEYAKDSKIKRTTGSVAGYVYYHYTNKSTDNNYLCQTVSLKERKFIDVLGEKDKDEFTVKIYPNEQRIVRLKVNKQGNSFYSFSTKIQFYIVQKYSLEKLKELADKKPTKVKKRQIQGKQIDVRIKTYNYSGGIVLLYQNKMDKYAYIQEITFQMDNLELENQTLIANRKLEIQLEPNSQKMLSFVVSSPGKQIVFRTKMSFYLNAPQFKF